MKSWKACLAISGILLGVGSANAQTFGDSVSAAPAAPTSGIVLKTETSNKPAISDAELEKAIADEREKIQQQAIDNTFIPGGGFDVLARPTADGSKRGGMAIVEVNDQGQSRRADKIFLYYENFKISGTLGGSATCDARFIVLSNLDKKLTSLDVKLVWPGLTTALSFSNVMPNTPTYLDYTLLGNGCYNMDKMPNIVVNRCRVKGMNSADCADKIVWLNTRNAVPAK